MDERAQDDADGPDPMLPAVAVATEPRPRRARKLGMGVGRTFAALVSIGVLGGMGYGWWAFGDVDDHTVTTDVIPPEVASQDRQGIPLDGAVDMLLVGVDSRTDAYGNPLPKEVMDLLHGGINDGERNTDTMILVHIPSDGTRAVAFSFPRDSWVDVGGGFGKHKLNSAFVYAYNKARGDLAKTYPDPKELERQAAAVGRKNLIATIENLIGHAVTVDRYAEVNLASFYEITKAIGGVDVCLNEAVNEPKSGANFPKGRQTVSGADALSFVRQRYGLPNGDLDRIVRQQVFLGGLADKVLSADMLTSPSKAHELVTAVQKSVVLSNGWELSRFAAQMQGLTSGNIDFYTIPTQGGAKIGGADVLRVDPAQVHQFVASLTRDASGSSNAGGSPEQVETPTGSNSVVPTSDTETTTPSLPGDGDTGSAPPPLQPGSITVDVRNASNTKDLAVTVQDRLVRQGFGRGTVGDGPVSPVSVVRYASGEQFNAQLVANSLSGEFGLEPDLSLPSGHVLVVLGTDFPVSQAQGFLARPVLNFAPTKPSAPTSPDRAAASSTAPPKPIVAGAQTCVN